VAGKKDDGDIQVHALYQAGGGDSIQSLQLNIHKNTQKVVRILSQSLNQLFSMGKSYWENV